MASKKSTKKVVSKEGEYVRINKTTIGVICHTVMDYDYDTGEDTQSDHGYVAYLDKNGETNRRYCNIAKLERIAAPQYVVVWSDHYEDPMCQFATRAEADVFAARKRKSRDVVEIRVYKLTK